MYLVHCSDSRKHKSYCFAFDNHVPSNRHKPSLHFRHCRKNWNGALLLKSLWLYFHARKNECTTGSVAVLSRLTTLCFSYLIFTFEAERDRDREWECDRKGFSENIQLEPKPICMWFIRQEVVVIQKLNIINETFKIILVEVVQHHQLSGWLEIRQFYVLADSLNDKRSKLPIPWK